MGLSRGGQAVATSIAFVAIAGAIVATRVFVRLHLVSNWGADDALVVGSLVMSIALTILIKLQEEHGLGQHFASLAAGEYPKMLKPFYVSVIVYNLGITLVKLSILCQFLRFFADRRSRIICICMLCLIASYGAAMQFGSIFICTPVAYFWDRTIANGHCVNLLAFWFSNASFNIVTDLMICVLPVPVLSSLQLPRKQKFVLIAVFIVGGFGCITSVLRLHSLYIISHSTDVTWDNVGAATWSSVELNVGIVCACLPSLRPIVGLIWPHFNRSTQNRSRSNAGDIIVRRSTYVQHSAGRDAADEEDDGGRKSMDQAWDWRDSQAPSSCVPRNDKLSNVTVGVYRRSEESKEDAVEMEHR